MNIQPVKKAIATARRSLVDDVPTFFVVPSDKDEAPRTVALDQELQNELLGIAMSTLQRAADFEQVEYDSDYHIARRDEEVLLVPSDKVNDESVVFEIAQNLDQLADIHARTMVAMRTKMYGISFGTTPNERILFVRLKRVEGITADGRLFALAGDTLKAVKQPGMLIDRTFDLIVFPEGIVAFDSVTFERLIKNPDDVAKELRDNAKAVAKHVKFAPDTLKQLLARGEAKPMIRRKLRSIVERNHLAGVTMNEIKKALRLEGQKPSDYITEGQFDFDMSDAMYVLGFLDEGTWRGWRSKTHYAAGGRTVVK